MPTTSTSRTGLTVSDLTGGLARSAPVTGATLRGRGLPWKYYLGYTIARLSGLIILPIVSRALGADGLGRFEVALAAMTATTIVLDAGAGAAVIRFSRDQSFPRRDLLGAAVSVQSLAVLTAAAIFIPVMAFTAPAGESVLLLCGIVVAFAICEGFAVLGSGLLRSELRDGTYLGLSVTRLAITGIVGGLGTLAIGVPGALLGVAVGGAGFAGYALLRWRMVPHGHKIGGGDSRRRLATYGLPLMATTMSTWSLALSDRLFLQSSVSAHDLGQYSANYRVGSVILTFLAAPFALAWLPVAQYAEPEERRHLVQRWALGFTLVCLVAGLIVTAGSSALVRGVFGSAFETDRLVVALTAGSGWLAGMYYLVATPLLVGDATRPLAVAAFLGVIATLALNAGLIPTWGAHGAALATLAGYALLCAFTAIATRRVARRAA